MKKQKKKAEEGERVQKCRKRKRETERKDMR